MTTWGSGLARGSGLGLGARAGPLCAFILLEKYLVPVGLADRLRLAALNTRVSSVIDLGVNGSRFDFS